LSRVKLELCGGRPEGGIDDAEAFCWKVIANSNRDLDSGQRERLHQFLLIELWSLSKQYRPGNVTFSTVAGNTLPKRIVDWERSAEEGGRLKWQFADRTYERELPLVVSFDPELDRVGGARPLHRGLPGADPGADDLARLVGARGSTRARHKQDLRQGLLDRSAA
jgi:hypothetical protein